MFADVVVEQMQGHDAHRSHDDGSQPQRANGEGFEGKTGEEDVPFGKLYNTQTLHRDCHHVENWGENGEEKDGVECDDAKSGHVGFCFDRCGGHGGSFIDVAVEARCWCSCCSWYEVTHFFQVPGVDSQSNDTEQEVGNRQTEEKMVDSAEVFTLAADDKLLNHVCDDDADVEDDAADDPVFHIDRSISFLKYGQN